ncbi:TRAUB domain-containing protein [Colletotrichum orchidophilum]|uniref:Protein BFR2 n=1 Tax=Colletotrichum orchidophilum TaxID=1209926 RepID=A0A1G4AV84_9PEZI|nr:TRAUB domain-containing protein [Colletotrichum orchidophilum]OHE93054.1 TRAUB domain-containing protein [Colletotrichum orchidophilum]
MSAHRRTSDWQDKPAKDLDPEAEPVEESEDESGSEESADENAGTEHYVTVGKSKLREKEGVSLGPNYRGARVSRDALNDSSNDDDSEIFEDAQEDLDSDGEEYDDPDAADLAADEAAAGDEDIEISSDDALGESDDEKLDGFVFRGSSQPKDKKGGRSKRPTAADFISDDEGDGAALDDNDDDDEMDDSEDDNEGLTDGLDGSDEDEEDELGSEEESEEDSEQASDEDDEDDKPRGKSSKADARAEQRRLMNEGSKALAASISAAAQQDAQKGLAVREQRKTFDGLLNIRIRLQKALVATNSFSTVEVEDEGEEEEQNSEPYEAAEEAALKLLNTLDSFRASLLPAELQQTGGKRKRGDAFDAATSSQEIWEGIQQAEERAAKYRKKVLETWSSKTRSAIVEVKSRNLVSSQTSIVASLEEQLLGTDRLIKRTRTPRSCAPAQVARKVNEDPEIYDDADFYQLLLKELVEQRTTDSGNGVAAQPTVRWAAMKEAKTKKHVDRRASKGRKMRFNIHEKLQNFMAAEDRRAWEQEAVDRLFGTLFGQKMELGEQASDAEMEDDEEVDAEEAGLRLFRN